MAHGLIWRFEKVTGYYCLGDASIDYAVVWKVPDVGWASNVVGGHRFSKLAHAKEASEVAVRSFHRPETPKGDSRGG